MQSSDTPDWAALRAQFPTTGTFVYLDAARKGLLPQWSQQAIGEWIEDIYSDAGKAAFSPEMIEQTRRSVARLLGADPDTIALIKNTSEGINHAARALRLRPGDNVVVSGYEHESNTLPWRHLELDGVEVRIARGPADEPIGAQHYEKLIDARTRAVATSWVTYSHGFRTDVAALAELTRPRDILLVVDAIQGAGMLSTPLPQLGADVIVAGGHKFLFGLAGAGFMYVRPEVAERLTPVYAAKSTFVSDDRYQVSPTLSAGARRFEYGNPNFLGCRVQGRSAQMLADIGLDNIERYVRELTTYAIECADAYGIRIRTPRPWMQRAGTISLALEENGEAVVARLRQRNIICSLKDGNVRISPHFYNTRDEIDLFFDALEKA